MSDITARSMHIGNGGDDVTPRMDEYAQRIAKHLMPQAYEHRDEVIAQVQSIVPFQAPSEKQE